MTHNHAKTWELFATPPFRDAFGNEIPDWAVYAHYERVDVSSVSWKPLYMPGRPLVERVQEEDDV